MREEERDHISKTGLKEIIWFVALWGVGVATILTIGGIIKIIL